MILPLRFISGKYNHCKLAPVLRFAFEEKTSSMLYISHLIACSTTVVTNSSYPVTCTSRRRPRMYGP